MCIYINTEYWLEHSFNAAKRTLKSSQILWLRQLKLKMKIKIKILKLLYFRIDDEKLLEKYKTIWNETEDLKNIDLNALPVYDDRYIKTNIRIYSDKVFMAKNASHQICHAYPTTMKLGIVIPYLKKIQETYKSCNTPLEFC